MAGAAEDGVGDDAAAAGGAVGFRVALAAGFAGAGTVGCWTAGDLATPARALSASGVSGTSFITVW